MGRVRCLAAALAASLLVAARASADDKPAAQSFLDEGIALMETHDYPAACAKFRESLAASRALAAVLLLADCYERNGQTASAWVMYREAIGYGSEKTDPRVKVAQRRLAALEPRVSYLAIVVPSETAVPGFELTRDGSALTSVSWNTAFPIDPGEHLLHASATGKRPWTRKVRVEGDGARIEVTVPPLQPALETPATAAQRAPAIEPVRDFPPPPRPASDEGLGLQRTVGIISGSGSAPPSDCRRSRSSMRRTRTATACRVETSAIQPGSRSEPVRCRVRHQRRREG
jgi:hypothetical protein